MTKALPTTKLPASGPKGMQKLHSLPLLLQNYHLLCPLAFKIGHNSCYLQAIRVCVL